MRYGSDVVIEWLAALGVKHVAINPGATIRGLHESLVRDQRLETVFALHEETAVGIAHGFWKATGSPMAVFVHDLVGLQHASMALFNATVDRAAMLVIGGAGPRDETSRRPWLDWVHSSASHSAWARDVVKWAAEPASLLGVRDALARGMRTAVSAPEGPVYICVDTEQQEASVSGDAGLGELPKLPPFRPRASSQEVTDVARMLASASHPVIVVDRPVRGGRSTLVPLVEQIGAAVVDLGGGFSFPTTHWADQTESRPGVLAEADLILVLEARDVAWALSDVDTGTRRKTWLPSPSANVIAVGCGALQNVPGVVLDELVPSARHITSDVALFLNDLLTQIGSSGTDCSSDRRRRLSSGHDAARSASRRAALAHAGTSPVRPAQLAMALHDAIKDGPWVLANGIVKGWPQRLWDFGDRGEFLGRSGGEGLGYGMPASIGAAIGHRDSDRLVVNLQADGDLLYTASALWTVAHHQLPLLTVMYNNASYAKDELHQRETARLRGRSTDTTHIAIRMDDPPVDFAKLAQAQGVEGIGPVDDPARLPSVLAEAVRAVREERRPILVDVRCSE